MNKEDVRLGCYQSQVVINSGSCAGSYAVRVCAETQDQADSKVQQELQSTYFQVPDLDECKRGQTFSCNMLGGTVKHSDCQKTCLKLVENEIGLFCKEDSTCHVPGTFNYATTRRCCLTLNQYKAESEKICRNVDENALDAAGVFAVSLANSDTNAGGCQETNCVSPLHVSLCRAQPRLLPSILLLQHGL